MEYGLRFVSKWEAATTGAAVVHSSAESQADGVHRWGSWGDEPCSDADAEGVDKVGCSCDNVVKLDKGEALVAVQVGLGKDLFDHQLDLGVLQVLLRVELVVRWVACSRIKGSRRGVKVSTPATTSTNKQTNLATSQPHQNPPGRR